jgi:fructose-1,6-bisphosphatase
MSSIYSQTGEYTYTHTHIYTHSHTHIYARTHTHKRRFEAKVQFFVDKYKSGTFSLGVSLKT